MFHVRRFQEINWYWTFLCIAVSPTNTDGFSTVTRPTGLYLTWDLFSSPPPGGSWITSCITRRLGISWTGWRRRKPLMRRISPRWITTRTSKCPAHTKVSRQSLTHVEETKLTLQSIWLISGRASLTPFLSDGSDLVAVAHTGGIAWTSWQSSVQNSECLTSYFSSDLYLY